MTALGRQENWEESPQTAPPEWWEWHDSDGERAR